MSTMERAPAATTGSEERRRVQLDFTQEAYERLIKLRKEADLKTNAELVRNALRLYDWFLEQRNAGYKIHLVKDEKVKEVEIVF